MYQYTDKNGLVLCRFCYGSRFSNKTHRFNCRIGDTPGPVDADRACCDYGELCPESERDGRACADVDPKWNL